MQEQTASIEVPTKRSHKLPMRYFFVLSVIACTAGCLLSQGNGNPNALYFFIAVFVLPMMVFLLRKRLNWKSQLGILLAGGAACFLLAYNSSRVSPERAFKDVFAIAPPMSVSNLEARKQYYDGFAILLSFTVNDADFTSLCKSAKLELTKVAQGSAADVQSLWATRTATESALAWNYWPKNCPATSLEEYTPAGRQGLKSNEFLFVLRDPTTGRVWVVWLYDFG